MSQDFQEVHHHRKDPPSDYTYLPGAGCAAACVPVGRRSQIHTREPLADNRVEKAWPIIFYYAASSSIRAHELWTSLLSCCLASLTIYAISSPFPGRGWLYLHRSIPHLNWLNSNSTQPFPTLIYTHYRATLLVLIVESFQQANEMSCSCQ